MPILLMLFALACSTPEPQPATVSAPASATEPEPVDSGELPLMLDPQDRPVPENTKVLARYESDPDCEKINPLLDHKANILIIPPDIDWGDWMSGRTLDPKVIQKREANQRQLKTALASAQPTDRWLLLIHGTGIQTAQGFQAMHEQGTLDALRKGGDYKGILAMDYVGPNASICQNLKVFGKQLEALDQDLSLDVDIVAISKGGLIARTLAFNDGGLQVCGTDHLAPNKLEVGKAFLIVTPNQGTPSAKGAPLYLATHRCEIHGPTEEMVRQTKRGLFCPERPEDKACRCRYPGAGSLDQVVPSEMEPGSKAQECSAGLQKQLSLQEDDPRFYTIGSRTTPDKASCRVFDCQDNDFVVPTASGMGTFPSPKDQKSVLQEVTHLEAPRQPMVQACVTTFLGPDPSPKALLASCTDSKPAAQYVCPSDVPCE